jgi:DNA-binding LacI/PurR family transcriptional regulator/signal transduction histidine kinase/CheY-like chemotaxis protein
VAIRGPRTHHWQAAPELPVRGVRKRPARAVPAWQSILNSDANAGVTSVRKTIAVLVDYIDHLSRGYEYELREAFESATRELNVNLLLLAGRTLDDDDPWIAAQNGVYKMLGAGSVDGIILCAAGLAAHSGVAAVERLAQRHPGLPTCSLGLELPGVPSVVVDNRSGMEALVEHMVVHHACNQIVFLGGPEANPDAQLRLQVFREVMARHGRPIDPNLVLHTDFTFLTGKGLTEALLLGGASFDAVIAANDGLGLGASEALRAHNLRVPLNVRVTGFDDLAMSRLGDPPLSTVRQPLKELACASVDIVMAQIAGQRVPACTTLGSEFLPRESCGCGSQAVQDSLPPLAISPRGADFVRANSQRLLRLLVPIQRSFGSAEHAAHILASLEAELNGERLAFVAGLEHILSNAKGNGEIYEDFQRALTLLRSELSSVQDPELEELWHEARLQVALIATRSHARQTAISEDRYDRLLKTGERFATNLDLPSLKAVLLRELPIAHVQSAFVSLCVGSDQRMLEPFFCLRDGQLAELPPEPYPSDQLFPRGMVSTTRRQTWIVFPLTFEAELLGVVAFEHAASFIGYEMFRDRIGTALKTASMHQEIVRQAASEERNNQERLAAAERIKSLSVLAGGVAHDLNNALGPLSSLPDVILQELQELNPRGFFEGSEIATDLSTIKSAALRAAETIKDLLTLGRQRQVSKEPVDLSELAASCAAAISAVQPQDCSKSASRRVDVRSTFASEQLFVHGSEPHLARAVTNLLSNALEASDGPQPVHVRTFAVHLSEPLSGYEVVEPGDYAVVSVRDLGRGISRAEMRRIFEPFFSSKKLRDSSGSGIGLAVVHGVVKEHGGFIDVESTPGGGTTFTLYFPRSAAAPRYFEKVPVLERGAGKLLVLDDDPMQLRTARRILTRAGYSVSTADTGKRARELFEAFETGALDPSVHDSPFDLIIVDMILNEQEDGLEIFEYIRRIFPHQRGVLVSGHAPMERGALALELGMAWLSKPYPAEALLHAVQRTLRRPATRTNDTDSITDATTGRDGSAH